MTHYLIRMQKDGSVSLGTAEADALAVFRPGLLAAIAITTFKMGCIVDGDTYDVYDAEGELCATDEVEDEAA